MSHDIAMRGVGGQIVTVEHFTEGGTYAISGTNEAELNVTYNYSPFYYKHLDGEKGITWLYGKAGAETAPRLREAIARIADMIPEKGNVDEDYWKPTAGNAILPLKRLLAWAEQHPTAVFEGD